ncbi:MAG: pyridoxal phosphate-dependent aminotransferase [Defluviitaleaceae bacterium]|nr:pyridoxal phosphate-dependent aminotransferase [Defluviitaleaceae bacterium]
MAKIFDKIIDRYGTYSIKYDPVSRGRPQDVLPMWVADMDFAAPSCVTDALTECVRHGIFGYSDPDAAYFDVVQGWFFRRFNWSVEREWLVNTPGVVNAMYVAVRALTEAGDGVVIQQPVYYPFESAVRHTRKLLVNRLVYENEKYVIDFDDFENKIKQAKLFILCSPHNPVGRVWTRNELMRMGEICLKHGVYIFADEIWQDFVFSGHKHLVFSALAPEFADITITATAPSKTFNTAGLQHANIFIPDKTMRNKFKREYAACGLSQASITGLVSCKAAYEHGEEWLDALLVYLSGNMSLIRDFLGERLPKIRPVEPEGTYLAWLNCSALGFSPQELDEIITTKAKLWLSSGTIFGAGGEGFTRINAACPRAVLKDALVRLERVL